MKLSFHFVCTWNKKFFFILNSGEIFVTSAKSTNKKTRTYPKTASHTLRSPRSILMRYQFFEAFKHFGHVVLCKTRRMYKIYFQYLNISKLMMVSPIISFSSFIMFQFLRLSEKFLILYVYSHINIISLLHNFTTRRKEEKEIQSICLVSTFWGTAYGLNILIKLMMGALWNVRET